MPSSIWTSHTLVWVLQILILTLGIHLFLRFVRATRGNRLIRGVVVTVLGGYIGLRLLASAINAEELQHLLEAGTGCLIVTLAIVLQTELRRGIAQLGERSWFQRFTQSAGRDSLTQISQAAQSMAAQRMGALIAFERETSLRSYIEEGTPIDADVNARLLESLFHPSTALHDGAVIVRKDRIAAAGCFFPLPQDAELDANFGTRHRAAVGITEDSDAVVVVVSEETGNISIASEGQLASLIEPVQLGETLTKILQSKDGSRSQRRQARLPRPKGGWGKDVYWILASLVIAFSVLVLSHQAITAEESVKVTLIPVGPSEQYTASPGDLVVVLPSDDVKLRSPLLGQRFDIVVRGTRSSIGVFGDRPSGTYALPYLPGEGEGGDDTADRLASFIDLERVRWDSRAIALSMEWGTPPELVTESILTREFSIAATDLVIDTTTLESGAEIIPEGIQFDPPSRASIAIRGPETLLDGLGENVADFFEPLSLMGSSLESRRAVLRISGELSSRGLALVDGAIFIDIPVQPSVRYLDTVTCSVALVSFDPARAGEVSGWRIPAHRRELQVGIYSTGLIPQDAELDSPVWSEKIAEVRRYVEGQLDAYVDISELAPGSGARAVTARARLRDADWRENLAPILLNDGDSWLEAWRLDALSLRLAGDLEILLEEVSPESESGEDG